MASSNDCAKGIIGYQDHQVLVLSILVANNMYFNTKYILTNFISFEESLEEICIIRVKRGYSIQIISNAKHLDI